MKLQKVKDIHFSIIRKKYGRGFQYFWLDGEKIKQPEQLNRFKKLVIPPMWQGVKICELDHGHIQATGFDAKQRKQYVYHANWQYEQQQLKFQRIVRFANLLPAMRKTCLSYVAQSNMSRERVLATMVLVLDETGIRIGNDRYSQSNQTYGLSTLRRKHLVVTDDNLIFAFKGKSGKQRSVEIQDPLLLEHVRHCAMQPGYELFRFQDEQKKWHDLDSEDVNDFIQLHMGEEFTSKDFRTWVGTRLAYELYPQALQIVSSSARKNLLATLVKLVSAELGNTPAICRDYYIHPKLLALIEQQKLNVSDAAQEFANPVADPKLSISERALIEILA